MKINLPLIMLLLCLLSFTACQEDDDATIHRSLLLHKSWVITAATVQNSNGTEEDWYAHSMEDCQKEDELTFFENGLYKISPGNDFCEVSVEETGSWELKGNKLVLVDQPVTVLELTETTLKMQYVVKRQDANAVFTTVYRPK